MKNNESMEISKYGAKGGLIISEEAVSSIATNAAKDVDGVTGFSNRYFQPNFNNHSSVSVGSSELWGLTSSTEAIITLTLETSFPVIF